MSIALRIGLSYLRSKKRSTVSVITFIAVGAVALGVGALLAVLGITSGFQDEFRNKVLGVNAHVLVLKYGLDFDEYRDVVATARAMPEVRGAAPFSIHEMMLTKGDRLSVVLVKGVDPAEVPNVLDLPNQIIDGSLRGLRRPNAAPPVDPLSLEHETDDDLDAFLRELSHVDAGAEPDAGALSAAELDALLDRAVAGEPLVDGPATPPPPPPAPGPEIGQDVVVDELPAVDVPTPEEAQALLDALGSGEGLPSDEQELEIAHDDEAALGEPETPDSDLPGIVVGRTLATTLGLGVGDRVRVSSPLSGLDTSLWAPTTSTPRSRELRVIGIFEAGFQEYDTRLVYVDLYEAQSFFDHGDSVTGVEISLHDIDRAPGVAAALERSLGEGPFHTMDWEELNHNLFAALQNQKIILSIAISTIILVAAFCVIATLIMMVLEKKREIAILKAMGATDASVLGIFLVQGTVIGLVGTLAGLLLGGGFVAYLATYEFPLDPKVYLIDHIPVRTSLVEVATTVGVALVICVIATLIPSYWAARLLPAEGVRHE